MADALTPTQRLATVLLGRDLGEWVAERRDPEALHPWRLIAQQLRKATDGQVDVTGETLRSWYGDLTPVKAAS